jgi:hypothetical protein
MCQHKIISFYLFIFVSHLYSQSGYSFINDTITIEINGEEKIFYSNEYLLRSNAYREIIIFSKVSDNLTSGIIVLEHKNITNFFIVPDQYKNLITAPFEIEFSGYNKAKIIFHCNPSNNLYAIYDFNNNKIEYYYCSSVWFSLDEDTVIYIRETRKNYFDIYRNNKYLASIENIGPIRITHVDTDKIFIRLSNGQEKEILY